MKELEGPNTLINLIQKLLQGPAGLYTVFVKIKYKEGRYAMCGNQFGLIYRKNTDFNGLYAVVLDRLNISFRDYNISAEDLIHI